MHGSALIRHGLQPLCLRPDRRCADGALGTAVLQYTELRGAMRSCAELRGATRSYAELRGARTAFRRAGDELKDRAQMYQLMIGHLAGQGPGRVCISELAPEDGFLGE